MKRSKGEEHSVKKQRENQPYKINTQDELEKGARGYGQRKTFQQSRLTIYRATTATYCRISWWNKMLAIFFSFAFPRCAGSACSFRQWRIVVAFGPKERQKECFIVRSSWGESDGHHSNLFLYLIGLLRAIIILTYDYVITVHCWWQPMLRTVRCVLKWIPFRYDAPQSLHLIRIRWFRIDSKSLSLCIRFWSFHMGISSNQRQFKDNEMMLAPFSTPLLICSLKFVCYFHLHS